MMIVGRVVHPLQKRTARSQSAQGDGRRHVLRFGATLPAAMLLVVVAVAVLSTGSIGPQSTPLAAQDMVARASVDSGSGYWVVTSTGQVYCLWRSEVLRRCGRTTPQQADRQHGVHP